MVNPYKATHDLYIIPMHVLESDLKKWFVEEKKINLSFKFNCEGSESSFGHMGDLYFIIDEKITPQKDLVAFKAEFVDAWSRIKLVDVLEEFLDVTNLSYDVEPYDKEVYIMVKK